MQQKGLSIIIPTFNESSNIANLVKQLVWLLDDLSIPYEIIVVDDHSSDQTAAIVHTLSRHYPVRLLTKKGKQGRGYSILQGYADSVYGYLAIIDGDTYAPELPEYLPRLFDLAIAHGYAYAKVRRSNLNHWFSLTPYQGPKVFRREIFDYLDEKLISAWVIGSPLIKTAQALGFSGAELDISVTHLRRPKPFSEKLNRKFEKLKGYWRGIRHSSVFTFPSTDNDSMVGAGVIYRQKRFVTHTTLPLHLSAMTTFSSWQKLLSLLLLLLFALGLVIDSKKTLITGTAILSLVYLLDVIFNLIISLKSLHSPPEIKISNDQIAALDDKELPIYTILCPLYKEAKILPQFVAAMSHLEWPKDKLDVILLLEEDDEDTIKRAKELEIPSFIRTLIVPHSSPKTKPKACNYGLAHAKGEYVVIYDAEDLPDSYQLKKAYLAFRQSNQKVACLQAKLNYYNPHQNLLTRLFTSEYSLWFDVILPGLQSINTSIPLGGTSNHFRTPVLRNLKGWDPFNVTEDADLGTRLFSAGYQTAIFDSTTLEEANSSLKNWFRQRSRWLKGYMQTYLVHMRSPLALWRNQGWHALIFNLVVGGKLAFILINPLLWLMTASYFLLHKFVGPQIEAIYPAPVFYMALTSLVVGNFTALYNYMIGTAKRGHWDLVKHVYLIPLYWLAISYAALIALFQLLVKPHYWEKTIHGLHLNHEPIRSTAQARKVQNLADQLTSSVAAGGAVVIASVIGNFLNFLSSAYLARNLSLEDFGSINLFGSLLLIVQVPIGALGNAVTHRAAYLLGKYQTPVKAIWAKYRASSLKYSLYATLLYLAAIPLLRSYFVLDSVLPFLLFAPAILIGTLAAVDNGFLGGNLLFIPAAILIVIEAVTKLGIGVTMITLGRHDLVYAAIPLSMGAAFLLGYLIVKTLKAKSLKLHATETVFPTKFYLSAAVSSLTALTYTTLDLILAKHYLSPTEAGIYSYLSLAGKMIFLASGMFGGFVIPYISRAVGAGKEDKSLFRRLTILVLLGSLAAFVVFGLLGFITVPILWGSRGSEILPYLIPYSLAMVAFSLSALYVRYHLARGENIFAYTGLVIGVVQCLAIIYHHGGIDDIAESVEIAAVASLLVNLLLSRFYQEFLNFYHALVDLAGLFRPLPTLPPLESGHLRILIFNWRDTRHVWAGGAEKYLQELSRRWVAAGHQVTIFCGNDGKSKRYDQLDGIRIIRRGGFYLVYLWAFLYYSLRLRGKYDLIIDSENGLPFFTPLYAQEKIYLLIHHVHQEVFRSALRPPFSWLASFLEKRVMPFVYRHTEVITVSPSSKAEILAHQLTEKDPHVIYNGVDLALYKPGNKNPTPLILYLGRLTTAKSIHILIRAAALVYSRLPNVRVVIAGDGPAKHSLQRLTHRLHLDSVISFVGKVTEAQKLNYYQRAWVFVNPSLIEGWGITTIEANACATPVVASNVAGLRDAVHNPHSGFLVPYGDVDEFANTITDLLTDQRKRARMSRESVKWATKFEWDKSAEVGLNILKG